MNDYRQSVTNISVFDCKDARGHAAPPSRQEMSFPSMRSQSASADLWRRERGAHPHAYAAGVGIGIQGGQAESATQSAGRYKIKHLRD